MIQPTNVQMPTQAQYPQQGVANAVKIDIHNPQAFGTVPNSCMMPSGQQAIYDMPYMPTYSDAGMTNPMAYQQFIPTYNQYQPRLMAPQAPEMPQSVMTPEQPVIVQPQVQVQPQQIIEQPQAAQEAQAQPVQEAQTQAVQQPEVVQPQQPAQTVDVDALVNDLKSTDANVKGEAIKKIAGYAQEAPEVALQVVSEPIMQSLVDIIKEDTSNLPGPTAEQQKVMDKIQKGEKLTAEEQAIAEQQSSPQEVANHNKTIAIYTLAMIQKLQREELNQYIESQKANGQQAIAPLNINDLIGYNEMADIAQNSKDENLKLAAIEALGHVVEPQDKTMIEPILTEAQKSQNENVKNAANEAMAKFAA